MTDDRPQQQIQLTLAGHVFTLVCMDDREQFIYECAMLRALGPALAAGVSPLVHALADQLVTLARLVAGEGDSFDLAKLRHARKHLDTADAPVRVAWERLLMAAPGVAVAAVSDAIPSLAERLTPDDLLLVFEVSVLAHGFVLFDGAQRKLTWAALRQISSGDPSVKWALLGAAFTLNYLGRQATTEPAPHNSEVGE